MTTVLVTGASRGLGLEFVRQYAAEGCHVIATCRDPAAATALAATAAAHPGAVDVAALDVTDHAAVDRLAAALAGTAVDILLNNAGEVGPRDPGTSNLHRQQFGTMDYAAWRRVLEVNTLAPVKVAEAFLPHVLAGTGRRMVFVSSQTGSNAEGRHPVMAYCSSKAALNKVVGMLAMTLGPRGVTCAAVCPGHVKTDLGGAGAALEPAQSVAGLRRVIAALTPADGGSCRDWTGRTVPW